MLLHTLWAVAIAAAPASAPSATDQAMTALIAGDFPSAMDAIRPALKKGENYDVDLLRLAAAIVRLADPRLAESLMSDARGQLHKDMTSYETGDVVAPSDETVTSVLMPPQLPTIPPDVPVVAGTDGYVNVVSAAVRQKPTVERQLPTVLMRPRH